MSKLFLAAAAIAVLSFPVHTQADPINDQAIRQHIMSFDRIVITNGPRAPIVWTPNTSIEVTMEVFGGDYETILSQLRPSLVASTGSIPPCAPNHVEDVKDTGSVYYRWCDQASPQAGSPNEDVFIWLGGNLFYLGSQIVNCNNLPSDVQSGPACDGIHPQ